MVRFECENCGGLMKRFGEIWASVMFIVVSPALCLVLGRSLKTWK